MKTKTLTQLKRERNRLIDYYSLTSDTRVQKVIDVVRAERAPQVAELDRQIAAAEKARPAKKPRWPEGTPKNVLAVCERYWSGTTERTTYRIHCWNEHVVCTSYPSGGYSNNGGWHPTSCCFHFLALAGGGVRHETLGQSLEGRQSQKQLDLALAERTRDLLDSKQKSCV